MRKYSLGANKMERVFPRTLKAVAGALRKENPGHFTGNFLNISQLRFLKKEIGEYISRRCNILLFFVYLITGTKD